jgi:Big-like domain-containing protein
MDAQRKLERLLLTLLACCCTVQLILRFNPSEVTNHDAAYRLQAAYFKLWISNKQDLTNALEINDLIPILIRYGIDVPRPLDKIVVAPGTSLQNGTAIFLALPSKNQYSMAIPPSIQMISPVDQQDFVLGQQIKMEARVTDQNCQIIKVAVKINGEDIGSLPCTGEAVSGGWIPTAEGTNTITLIAYNEFGLTASAAASNITVHVNYPPTVQILQLEDEMAFTAGVTYKLHVAAANPNKTDVVTDVILLVNGKPIKTLNTAPYDFILGPLDPGIYTIHAQAHNKHGALGESYIYKIYVK